MLETTISQPRLSSGLGAPMIQMKTDITTTGQQSVELDDLLYIVPISRYLTAFDIFALARSAKHIAFTLWCPINGIRLRALNSIRNNTHIGGPAFRRYIQENAEDILNNFMHRDNGHPWRAVLYSCLLMCNEYDRTYQRICVFCLRDFIDKRKIPVSTNPFPLLLKFARLVGWSEYRDRVYRQSCTTLRCVCIDQIESVFGSCPDCCKRKDFVSLYCWSIDHNISPCQVRTRINRSELVSYRKSDYAPRRYLQFLADHRFITRVIVHKLPYYELPHTSGSDGSEEHTLKRKRS